MPKSPPSPTASGSVSAHVPAPEGTDERRDGERSEPSRSEEGPSGAVAPPTQVRPRPARRHFTADYKLRIVQEADACRAPGEVGALLRREGLYSPQSVCVCAPGGVSTRRYARTLGAP